ncbi:uncharacterized protein LOC144552036 [Carex rostrata]
MVSPSLTRFLILFALFITIVMAGTESKPQEPPTPFQQMVDWLFATIPLGNDSDELNWTVRARNNSDTKLPAPKNLTELIQECWIYFGHPQTIRDVKGFFKWGCQPYPITCDGIKALPKECIANMFSLNKNVRAPQIKELYSRCTMNYRPIDVKTNRYVSYCEDLITVLQVRIDLLASKGKGRRGEGDDGGNGDV